MSLRDTTLSKQRRKMMLALVEAHEKTLGSQQSVDPSCAFIVLMCREDFSITPPGCLSNSGSLSENVASCNPTLDRW